MTKESRKSRNHAPLLLADFLPLAERKGHLNKAERLRIVEQALLLLEMNYVHLPLKRAMHAIDPIQQLRLLRFHLNSTTDRKLSSTLEFHRQMLGIFASARDLHTLYVLPEPFKDRVAYLSCLVEQIWERRGSRLVEKFIIARTVKEGKAEAKAQPAIAYGGVEVLFWNGIPIRRAIEMNGDLQPGGNPEARFARGLDSLTIRPLDSSVPPDELWVDMIFRTADGREDKIRWNWLVTGDPIQPSSKRATEKRAAIDVRKSRINDVKMKLYASIDSRSLASQRGAFRVDIRIVKGMEYGYIRLFSFDVPDSERFIRRMVRLLQHPACPRNGIIIDVRGNGGGKIRAGERMLQLFTPNRIKPELFEFINSPLNLEICRRAPESWNLKRWVESMTESVTTGSPYSNGFPLNSEEACNDIGQIYHGPVVLVTDALSYSTTDIFAAGFQDNRVGVVLGTSGNTGAGGANVWWYEDFQRGYGRSRNSPFKPLPKGADMLVAMRRSVRVGLRAGRPLEELGITPDERHYPTTRDILQDNADLIERAAAILRSKPAYLLNVRTKSGKRKSSIVVEAASRLPNSRSNCGIARIDIYVDGRPASSIPATNGAVPATGINFRREKEQRIAVKVEALDSDNNVVAMRRLKM